MFRRPEVCHHCSPFELKSTPTCDPGMALPLPKDLEAQRRVLRLHELPEDEALMEQGNGGDQVNGLLFQTTCGRHHVGILLQEPRPEGRLLRTEAYSRPHCSFGLLTLQGKLHGQLFRPAETCAAGSPPFKVGLDSQCSSTPHLSLPGTPGCLQQRMAKDEMAPFVCPLSGVDCFKQAGQQQPFIFWGVQGAMDPLWILRKTNPGHEVLTPQPNQP